MMLKLSIIYLIYLDITKNWKSIEDVKPCLEMLSKYRLGIVSNGDLVQQKSKLEKLGFLDFTILKI